MKNSLRAIFACLAASLPLAGFSLSAATIPYLEDFDDDALGINNPGEPSPESGTFVPNGTFSIVDNGISGRSYSNPINGDAQANSLLTFSGLGGSVATAQNFTIASDFRFGSTSANSVTLGLAFLAGTPGGAVTSGYYVDIGASTDAIRLVKNGGSIITSTTTAVTGGVNLNEVYRLTISGIYVDSDSNGTKDAIDITATLLSGSTSVATFTYRDTAPSTGTSFGYRNRSNGPTSVLDGQMDNFSVTIATIPEPSTMMLGLGAMVGLLGWRRRR